MPQRKGLLAPQNTFLDTIATRFDGTHSNFVLGNAQVKEYPIVYCSDGFVELTGFSRSQIMSRSATCSFLWGVKTDATAKESIWTALRVHTELKIEVTFHKKNGSCFACLLDIVPIKNEKGQVVLFLVSHKDLTTQKKIGTSNSLLSCGLASTMTAAALIAKRQPALISPTPNHLSPRIPLTRKRLQSDALSSSRRASAPPANTSNSKNVPLMQFGSFGVNSKSTESTDTPPSVLNLESVMETAVGSNDETEQVKWLGPNFTTTFSDQKELESVSTSGTDSDPSTTYKYQRRRSRAVLYHLSGRFDKKNKPKMRFKNLIPHLSSKNSMPEYKVQDIKASRCILLHYSILKIVWDWLVVLCTFYFAVMVPYNAAFHNDTHERTLRTLDMILEVLFIVDILLNFRTTYVSKSGQVVHQSKEIAVNYIRGWFILDLIAAVPFDVIWTIQSPESPVANWMHLMKLARLLRLARLFQKIERYSQYSAVVLGILMCMFFLVAHWLACSWFGLGTNELMNPLTQNHSWLYELSERTHTPFHANMTGGPARSSFYISSLYFTMSSLTSVGFGNVSPNTPNEKIFSIIAMLVGALMHAAVFGNVTTIIQRMYARRSAYQSKNQDLKDFTRAHHLPKQLRQRMLEFYQAMWSINRGIDKQAIIQVFPEEMRGDIALHINREILSLPIFKSASIGCQKSIAQLIGTRFSTPGEFLVHRGDAIRYIYFVCSGSLEILDEEGSVVALLGKCDFFGTDIDERPFIGLSAYDVKALTYCELQFIVLDKTIFDVLDLYPKYLTEFSASLHDELSFNIKEGYDPFAKEEIETLAAITRRPSEDILPPKDVVDISNIENGRPAFLKHDLTHSDSLPFPIQLPFKPMRPFRISCPTVGGEYLKGSLECLLTRNSRCNSLASGEIDLASQTGGSREHSRWFLCEQDSLKNDYWTEKPSNPNHHSMETGLESRFPFACTRHHQSAESFFPHSITVNCQEQQAAVETVNKGIVHSNDTDDKTSQLSQESSQCAADFKELKLLMFYMAQNIQSMRQDMKSLCNEVNTLKQDMNRIQKNSTFSHRSSFKTGIMKASSTANSLSAEEFMPRRLQTGHLVKSRQYFSSSVTEDIEHSSHSENRCVKFRLPNSGGRNQHNHHHNQKGNSASPPHPLLKVSSEVQFESLPEYIEKVANNDVTTTLSTNSHSTNSISKPPSK